MLEKLQVKIQIEDFFNQLMLHNKHIIIYNNHKIKHLKKDQKKTIIQLLKKYLKFHPNKKISKKVYLLYNSTIQENIKA